MIALNKDKRSMALSLILGDGNLHVSKQSGAGLLTIDHGITQSDYQSWKAKLLSDIFQRDCKVRTGHKGKSVQVQVCDRRLRSWYKFIYVNKHKSIPRILRFINNPYFALAVLLMDDGYVEPSISKLSTGEKVNYSASLRIFLCDQTPEELVEIGKWFKDNFNITIKIRFTKKKDILYPFIKIMTNDSLDIWSRIREHVLQFKSMQYKFRYLEQIYQSRRLQRTPSPKA